MSNLTELIEQLSDVLVYQNTNITCAIETLSHTRDINARLVFLMEELIEAMDEFQNQ